ncbi:MAG TPA: choice-of-anchor B family protein [Candidatus Marinimicrobia bacterium]|nr:choice-of-anchor B family protein [Candidatus Neomarinimicrobiota bacterium]
MRSFITPVLLLFVLSLLRADEKTYALELVARVELPTVVWSVGDTAGGSDCWGYVDDEGTDYAIMGVLDGTAIVRAEDQKIITTIPGPEYGDYYYHRDMMTYGDYLYVCHEMTGTNQGIQIIDLSPLPDSVRYVTSYDEVDYAGAYATTSHNLFVDEATATLYLVRSSYDGFRVVSLDDPENLNEVGVAETPGIHDLFSRKDTVFVAEGYNKSFSIWDVTDKENGPEFIVRVNVPGAGYVHTVWTTDDGQYLMTAEETANKTVKMWDIRDYDDIELVGEYLGESKLAHNVHIKDDLAFISHYATGVTVVDISDPTDLREVARYDTFVAHDRSSYYGAWGVYPYSPNDYVYASNVEGHLDILKFQEVSSSVSENALLPTKISLSQNFPNPFNGETSISFGLSTEELVKLEIYNALGVRVKTIADGRFSAGRYHFRWNGSRAPSGVYFARLSTGRSDEVVKMLLLK